MLYTRVTAFFAALDAAGFDAMHRAKLIVGAEIRNVGANGRGLPERNETP